MDPQPGRRRRNTPGSITLVPVSVESLLEEQAELLRRGDAKALAARYREDAQIIHADGVANGRAEIEAVFAAQFAVGAVVESIADAGHGDDSVNYRAVLAIGLDRVSVAGTFVVVDGEIWRHTSIVTSGA